MHYLIDELPIFRKGKVREVYILDNQMLFVASDRISAFDVIMNQNVPDKGRILTSISEFWFSNTKHIIDNHLITTDVNNFPAGYVDPKHYPMLKNRSMLVRKATPLTVEFVVRGYLAGSGWKEYKKYGTVCGEKLPDGLEEYSKLPEPIFTPATKAESGHDENINFEECAAIIGTETAIYLKEISIALYNFGHNLLLEKGIILADTKFEFGTLDSGELILIDEALTPDSSRFWLQEGYKPGQTPTNYDKQILRDYLETLTWNKQYPPPVLPEEIITQTRNKYIEAFELITGKVWVD
jgi:phosphoribosylaminoimidazole-succinocarboxamide synthase